MSTTEQKALEQEIKEWNENPYSVLRRLSAENEALRADLADSYQEFRTCAQERNSLRAQVEALTGGREAIAEAAVVAANARKGLEGLSEFLNDAPSPLTGKPRETNLHDINAGIEVMAYLRESRAPHHIYSKMSACLFGDPDRTKAHPTPSPLTRPKVFVTLVRDVAADLGVKSLDVCAAIKELGFGDMSVNMEVTDEIEYKVREHFAKKSLTRPAVPDCKCTACGAPLKKVVQSANSYLSAEQFDADKLGDWFCENCPEGPNKGSSKHRYFWQHELSTSPTQASKDDK